jgi:hypothetical protein
MTGSRPRAGIRQLQRHLLPGGGGHDPLGQPLAHARGEDVGEPGRLVLPLGSRARTSQRGLHGAAGSLDARLLVGEQAGPEITPWDQQRVAAAEREPVLPRRGQCERGDLPVQVTDRHHGTRLRCTSIHRFRAAAIFYPNFYPNRRRR